MTRILHVSDLHNDQRWLAWVAEHCVEVDLVCIAGDLQNAFAPIGMHAQAKQLREWLVSLSAPICVVDGNHDFWTAHGSIDLHADGGWLKLLRGRGNVLGVPGDVIDFRDLRIACNGWLQVPDLDRPVDVLVTHAPPSGCQCAAGAEGIDVGDPDLWPAVQEYPPRIVLSGHIHKPRKVACAWPPIDPTSLVLVPGCDETADVPAHWMIDTDAGTASHSSGEEVLFNYE